MLDPQPLHSLPVSAWVRVGGGGLKQERGAAIGQGPVHHVAVARDPPDVRHAAEQLPGLVVEGVLVGDGRVEQVAGRAVTQALMNGFETIWIPESDCSLYLGFSSASTRVQEK